MASKKIKKLQDELASYVRHRFEEAKSAKAEEYERLKQCLQQVRGDDQCDSCDDVRVEMNITSPIVRGVVGLLRDVFSNSIDNPFVIKSTPIAELNDNAKELASDMLQRSLEEIGFIQGGMTKEQAADIGEELREALELESQETAERAAAAMNVLIQDNLRDADWVKEFGDFLYNFVVFPAAFMKAPCVKVTKQKDWEGNKMVIRDKIVRGVENISPFDIYPAPHAKTLDTAEFVIERRKMSKSELIDLYSVPGFHADGIEEVYTEYPGGYIEPYEDGEHGEEVTDDVDVGVGEHDSAQGFYDTIGFYGSIRGDILETFGMKVGDINRTYEAEIWMVNDIIIKANLNPDPLGRRPFFAASFEPIPGKIWGESPVSRLKGVHDVCAATIRALVRNMDYASGIQGEVDPERLVDSSDDPRLVQPNQIRLVDNDPKYGGQPTYRYYTIPDISQNLMTTFERFQQQGYEIIGIPRVAFGSSQNLGTVGRTSGGVAMVLNQASKSVKFALRIVEENIIEPVIQSFIDYHLMFSSNPAIQGDIRVYARGVSGIVEKENKEQKLEWVVQSISGWVGRNDETGQPIVPGSAVRVLLAKLFESAGIDTEDIFPNYKLQQVMGSAGASQPQTQPLVDGQLDARSGAVMDAIANQQAVGQNNGQPGAM